MTPTLMFCVGDAAAAVVAGEAVIVAARTGERLRRDAMRDARIGLARILAEAWAREEDILDLNDILAAVEDDALDGPDSDGQRVLEAVQDLRKTWSAQQKLIEKLADETWKILARNWNTVIGLAIEMEEEMGGAQ